MVSHIQLGGVNSLIMAVYIVVVGVLLVNFETLIKPINCLL